MNDAEYVPANGVSREKMAEELGYNTKAVGFVSVNGVVVLCERLLEKLLPHAVDLAESLTDETKKLVVRAFLRTALNNHRGHLMFQSRREIDAQQLVGTFLESTRRHDRQVDGTTKVDQVGVGRILDLHLLFLGLLLIVTAGHIRVIIVIVVFVTTISLAQYLCLQFLVCFLVRLPIRIELEDVQAILDLDLVVKTSVVGDLILLFHQVQLLFYSRVVLVFVLSDLKQDLNHVLYSFVDICLVENGTELVKHCQGNLRVELFDMLANFLHQANGDFDAVVCRLVEEK